MLGRELTKMRVDSGLSQKELAKIMNVSQSYVCDLENERRNISKIAEAFIRFIFFTANTRGKM